MAIMGAMMLVLVWLGLYPTPVINTAKPALQKIERTVQTAEVFQNNNEIDYTSVHQLQVHMQRVNRDK
jgi:NADH:ubiquinone oxidoreductase subunit 4 (subunit M)